MREESIHDKLARVVVRYEGGRIDPIEFRWKTRLIRIAAVNARWVDRQTRPIHYYFSVTGHAGDVFTLAYREGEPYWYLESVIVA